MKALLIIDMQAGSFSETARYDVENVVKKMNRLSDLFRKTGNKVIYIQHDGTIENCFLPNSPDWQILPELVVEPQDLFISKTANDSFYKTDLDKLLKDNSINKIIVTGCATDFCVGATIQSALVRDYNVTVIKDGHTTADRPNLNAKAVIDHYNWVWGNMTPTNGSINVVTFNDFVAEQVFKGSQVFET